MSTRGLLALALAVVAPKTPTGTTGIVIGTTSLGADAPVTHTPGANAQSRRVTRSTSTSWGAIMDEGKEVLDCSKEITFPADEEEGSSLVEVSEETKKLNQSKFTMSVPNEEETSKELLPSSQGRCSKDTSGGRLPQAGNDQCHEIL